LWILLLPTFICLIKFLFELETLRAKYSFEKFALSHGIKVKSYRADNVPFGAAEFVADLDLKGQTIDFSGTGAHHQNGVAEQWIQQLQEMVWTMLLHAQHCGP